MIDFEKLGCKPDSEFPGLYNIPGTPIYLHQDEEHLVISWDLEYSFAVEASEDKVIKLIEVFTK
jgi:hypothetical protein